MNERFRRVSQIGWRTAAGAFLALNVAACKSPEAPVAIPTRPAVLGPASPTISAAELVQSIPEQIRDEDIARDYPELKDFTVYSSGQFNTRKGVQIRWYNLTDAQFNPTAATSTFSYFEGIMPKEGLGVKLNYYGKDIPIATLPREGDQSRTLFITPNDAPPTSTWGFEPGDYPSGATRVQARKAIASYVHLLDTPPNVTFFNNTEAYANRGLAIEACQQFIITGLLSPEAEANPQKTANDAQEAVCNSIAGIAFALRQQGVPYETYSRIELTRTGFGYKLIQLGQEAYNSIPLAGKILTAK